MPYFRKNLRSEFKAIIMPIIAARKITFIVHLIVALFSLLTINYPLYSCGNNLSFKATPESISKIRLGLTIPDRFTSILQTKKQTDTCK